MTASIKEGMWRLAPSFEVTRFHDWAVAFDHEHHGFLVKLANSHRHRNILGKAVRGVQHTCSPNTLKRRQ